MADTHFTTGTTITSEWLNDVNDAVYHSDITAEGVSYTPPFTGSVTTNVEDKLAETVSAQDFGAVGDGVTDDTAAFTALEVSIQNRDIDLQDKSYKVDAIPSGNRYFDGEWVLDTGATPTRWQGAQLTGAGRIAFGDGALEDLPIDYSIRSTSTVVALGYNAMSNMTQIQSGIAIGSNAQASGTISRDNIAIGDSSLKNVQAVTPDYSQTDRQGTRNVGIGGNAGYFISGGYGNTVIGRNSGSCLVGDIGATAYGGGAMGGYAPIGLSGQIENWAPSLSTSGEVNSSVAIGQSALGAGISNYSVAVGSNALMNNKKSNSNVAVGPQALQSLDTNTWYNGGAYSALDISGTYTQSGTTLTLNFVSHGLVSGDVALFRLLDGGSQTFLNDIVPAYVVSATTNAFVITSPLYITSSGSAHLYGKATAAQQPTNDNNTVIGGLAGFNLETGIENTISGYRTMFDATNASRNVALGFRTLTGLSDAENCTAIGYQSLRFMVDGTVATGTGTNRTGLGYNTRVSGDNQVQIGDGSSTTYVYGTVQNRSDERDKADIQDTQLGLNFIEKLRPVDYRWDMRDDYFEIVEEGKDERGESIQKVVKHEKNGSKKRNRFHHGLIAQDVKRVINEMGIDFGGFQDHTVNGGCEVQTIGYDELIAPLIKAVQELSERLKKLES